MLLIIVIHLDLIVTCEPFNERHAFITTCVMNHDVGDELREFVIGTDLTKISKVDGDPDLLILLGDRNNICYPVWMLFILYELRVD